MGKQAKKIETYQRRKRRVRKNLFGSSERPRLSVFRSSRHMYAQIVNDENGTTLVAASTRDKTLAGHEGFESKIDAAQHVGKLLAERARQKGITKVIFDRNGFLYHGRVKAVSTGAREGGLEF